jgi:hypothetical protein
LNRNYPNPVCDGTLKLRFASKVENGTVSVYNIAGACVLKQSINGMESLELNVGSLNKGLYFLNVSTNSSSEIQKVIIK